MSRRGFGGDLLGGFGGFGHPFMDDFFASDPFEHMNRMIGAAFGGMPFGMRFGQPVRFSCVCRSFFHVVIEDCTTKRSFKRSGSS